MKEKDTHVKKKNLAKKVLIYNDVGVSKYYLPALKNFFSDFEVSFISATRLAEKHSLMDCDLFVIPGGADLFYLRELSGKANSYIRKYVEQGGAYLGICAGAYYASSFVEFDKGGNNQVLGTRELNFFDGKAVGPVLKDFCYSNSKNHQILVDCGKFGILPFTYNGGCYFEASPEANFETSALYKQINKPAIIHTKIGDGVALLSGVHIEILDFNDELNLTKITEFLKYLMSKLRL